MEFDGKVAIVTGGAVRLGQALALALAEHGIRVAVHYAFSAGPAEETVAEIHKLGSQAVAIQADLTLPGQASLVVERSVAHFGQVDVLVNSAAIFEPGGWDDTTEASWDRQFALNLKAPFFLSQAFARHVGRERRGHIVNIADWRGLRPGVDHVAYTLAKAGLIAMTRSLAQALAPTIQVNAIAPGLILPPPGEDMAYLERLAATIPARRVGSPAEVANALLFLLRSDFGTGDVILVTGGQHL